MSSKRPQTSAKASGKAKSAAAVKHAPKKPAAAKSARLPKAAAKSATKSSAAKPAASKSGSAKAAAAKSGAAKSGSNQSAAAKRSSAPAAGVKPTGHAHATLHGTAHAAHSAGAQGQRLGQAMPPRAQVPVERTPLRPPSGRQEATAHPGLRPPLGSLPPLPKGSLAPLSKSVMSKPMAPLPPARPQPPKQQPHLVRSFYWADLREGDDLPPLARPAIDRVQIARYAGAANDFNRLQLDEPYAHSLGFRGAFAPGALAMGFVGQLLTSWLKKGQVRRLHARFVKIIWPGDELTCHGRVSELRREKGLCYADLELWAENQKGELVLRGQATCELVESAGHGSSFGDFPRGPAGRPPPRRR